MYHDGTQIPIFLKSEMPGPSQRESMVYVIDDEEMVRDALWRLLRSAGFNAQGFASPAEILSKDLPGVPMCILLDMNLRDIDGREVAKQVKSNPDLQLTKVIAMSGKMTPEDAKGILAAGFDGFLRKPFHVRQVIEAIEDVMAVVY